MEQPEEVKDGFFLFSVEKSPSFTSGWRQSVEKQILHNVGPLTSPPSLTHRALLGTTPSHASIWYPNLYNLLLLKPDCWRDYIHCFSVNFGGGEACCVKARHWVSAVRTQLLYATARLLKSAFPENRQQFPPLLK